MTPLGGMHLYICIHGVLPRQVLQLIYRFHRNTSMANFESELLDCKNIGLSSANILHAVGINTREDLHRVGAVEAYCKIKQRGIPVSKVMLYALQGALLDSHWNDLDPALKTSLVEEAEARQLELEPH